MDTKPLAFLFVRLNGVLLLIYSVIEISYLPFNIRIITIAEGEEPFHSEAMQDLALLVLRFALQLLFGLALMARTEKIINFLLADLAIKQKEDKKKLEQGTSNSE